MANKKVEGRGGLIGHSHIGLMSGFAIELGLQD